MLVLHQYEISPFCDKVRRVLHWKGVPYTVNEIALADRRRVRALSPAGKLPVIEHEGRAIADSTEIAYYLEQRFPQHPLVPEDPVERARVHVLEDWADESLYFYEMRLRFTLAHNAVRTLPRLLHADAAPARWFLARVMPRGIASITRTQGTGRMPLAQALREVERHVQAIDGLLCGGDWLVAGRLTLADLAVFAEIACIAETDEGAAILARVARVGQWMARVREATDRPRAA
jgi:glutathione S-transferase